MFDWQIIAALGVLALAISYAGWRLWRRISSFRMQKSMNAPSCGGSCGCDSSTKFSQTSERA